MKRGNSIAPVLTPPMIAEYTLVRERGLRCSIRIRKSEDCQTAAQEGKMSIKTGLLGFGALLIALSAPATAATFTASGGPGPTWSVDFNDTGDGRLNIDEIIPGTLTPFPSESFLTTGIIGTATTQSSLCGGLWGLSACDFFLFDDGYGGYTVEGIDRWTSYTVTGLAPSSVPVPAALPLLASGLGALGVFGWQRKRKLAQATV
jgi:hypothetical protein